jgi:hypothetical protein
MEDLGKYCGNLWVAGGRAKFSSAALLTTAVLFPVAVQTAFHPADAIGFEYWLQRQPIPRFFTMEMVSAGEITAAMALIGLSLFMLGATVLFYRGAGFWVQLWPVAGVLVGLLGNCAWWLDKGFFDATGALAGLASLALMVACEAVCEHLGADFVFGHGRRPKRT